MNAYLLVIALLSAVLSCPSTALAFGGNEHNDLGNTALKIAFDYFESTLPEPKREQYQELRQSLQLLPDKVPPNCWEIIYAARTERKPDAIPNWCKQITYGVIVRQVDDFKYPEKMLYLHGNTGGYPRSIDDFNLPEWRQLISLEAINSAHNNEEHFQSVPLLMFTSYHNKALGAIKQNDSNLFGALVLNAMADHYLHDFFAPGHISAPREQLSDVMAVGSHDYYNKAGAIFYVNQERWNRDLLPILRFIQANESLFLAMQSCKDKKKCKEEERREFYEKNIESLLMRPDYIVLYGDDMLDTYQCVRAKLFVLLVEIRSILDILEKYEENRDHTVRASGNHFEEYTWHMNTLNRTEKSKDVYCSRMAGMPYGDYEVRKRIVSYKEKRSFWTFSNDHIDSLVGRPTSSDICTDAKMDSIVDRTLLIKDEDDKKIRWNGSYENFSSLLMVRLANETVITHHQSSRATAEVMLAGGVANTNYFERNENGSNVVNTANRIGYENGALGIGYLVNLPNHDFREYGPTFNALYIYPKLGMHFGLYARYLTYATDYERKGRATFGGTVGVGFSMLDAYFGMGSGYGIDESRKLERGVVFTAGVTVAFPPSRLLP